MFVVSRRDCSERQAALSRRRLNDNCCGCGRREREGCGRQTIREKIAPHHAHPQQRRNPDPAGRQCHCLPTSLRARRYCWPALPKHASQRLRTMPPPASCRAQPHRHVESIPGRHLTRRDIAIGARVERVPICTTYRIHPPNFAYRPKPTIHRPSTALQDTNRQKHLHPPEPHPPLRPNLQAKNMAPVLSVVLRFYASCCSVGLRRGLLSLGLTPLFQLICIGRRKSPQKPLRSTYSVSYTSYIEEATLELQKILLYTSVIRAAYHQSACHNFARGDCEGSRARRFRNGRDFSVWRLRHGVAD